MIRIQVVSIHKNIAVAADIPINCTIANNGAVIGEGDALGDGQRPAILNGQCVAIRNGKVSAGATLVPYTCPVVPSKMTPLQSSLYDWLSMLLAKITAWPFSRVKKVPL